MKDKRILIAPDSFKGSLSAYEAANAIDLGFKSEGFSDTLCIPMADGGEGTVETLCSDGRGSIVRLDVAGPLGNKVEAFYGILKDNKTAIIEMAAASGLPLIEDTKKPLVATTFGTGELILDALNQGCENIIIGLGGSATNDGGMGMAKALGVKFMDKDIKKIGEGGGALIDLAAIDISKLDKRISSVNIQVACDVDNPLCGENGASAVYGPQKGATPEMIKLLDSALYNMAQVIKKDLSIDILDLSGSGAAGGLGGGLVAFLGGKLKKGVDIIMNTLNIEESIKRSDIVITGEGKADFQTAFGKVPAGIASLCTKHDKPLICISGALGEGYESLYDIGISEFYSICNDEITIEYAMKNAKNLLESLAQNVAYLLK